MLVSPDPALDRWWGQGGVSVIPGEANFPTTLAPAGFPLPLHAGEEGLAQAALTGASARLDHDAGTAAASLPPLTQSEAPGAGWVPPPSPGSQPRHLHDAEHALDDTSAPRDMSHDGHVPAHAHDGAAPLGLGRLRLPAFELGPAAPALGDALSISSAGAVRPCLFCLCVCVCLLRVCLSLSLSLCECKYVWAHVHMRMSHPGRRYVGEEGGDKRVRSDRH